MWDDAASIIEQQLSAGERLLWSGQPRGGVRLHAADIFAIPFSVFWCGFAIFWVVMAMQPMKHGGGGPATTIFPLFGLPFVAVGLYMVFGRFIVDARIRAKTFYGVTSDRVILISGLFSRRTKSLNLRTISDLSLTERADGSGTITFGPALPFGQFFSGASWPGASQFSPPMFEMIEQAREVYDIIRQAQKSAG
jgi:hypothetical protein